MNYWVCDWVIKVVTTQENKVRVTSRATQSPTRLKGTNVTTQVGPHKLQVPNMQFVAIV